MGPFPRSFNPEKEKNKVMAELYNSIRDAQKGRQEIQNLSHLRYQLPVKQLIERKVGSVYNWISLCGFGTYLFLGPSGEGKNVLLSELIFQAHATRPVNKRPFTLAFDTTESITGDLKSMAVGEVAIKDLEGLQQAMDIRSELLEKAKDPERIPPEQWIINDVMGATGLTNNNSVLSALVSKARHLRLYVFVLIQHFTGISKAIRCNALAIFALKIAKQYHKDYVNFVGVDLPNTPRFIEEASSWNNQSYHCVVYPRTWAASGLKTRPVPLFLEPCPVRRGGEKRKMNNDMAKKVARISKKDRVVFEEDDLDGNELNDIYEQRMEEANDEIGSLEEFVEQGSEESSEDRDFQEEPSSSSSSSLSETRSKYKEMVNLNAQKYIGRIVA